MLRPMNIFVTILLLVGCKPEPEPKDSDSDSAAPVELTWATVAEHSASALMGVAGRSATDVLAVGAADANGGAILHWDGTAWTRLTNSDTHDLWWALALDDAWVVAGAGGTVLVDDGSGFSRLATPGLGAQTIYGVWGTSLSDLWVVGGFAGRDGFIWRYDGATWTDVPLPDDVSRPDGEAPAMFKVWGTAADDVWVVGDDNVLHYDGADWSVVATGAGPLFTVHGAGDRVVMSGANGVWMGDADGLDDVTPEGMGAMQGAYMTPDGGVTVAGSSGAVWSRDPAGDWIPHVNALTTSPESLHAVYVSGADRFAVGGAVLTGALDLGVIAHQGPATVGTWAYEPPVSPAASCPAGEEDPVPTGSIARRWNAQLLNAIRRDIPRPGVHSRNLFHSSVAMWDAWAVYDDVADPVIVDERVTAADVEEARAIAISYAAYRVLTYRYGEQTGGATSVECFDGFMDVLGLDPADTTATGDSPVAVGNRIAAAVLAHYEDDGANEAANYADTTSWDPVNEPLVVDQPGANAVNPDEWQTLNLASAETQNGIVLDSGRQGYICPTWGTVEPWALTDPLDSGLYLDPGEGPKVADPATADDVLDILRKHSKHDPTLSETIDISPGAYGNNPLGSNDGTGHPVNPVTGLPYTANVVKLGDFSRVLSEFWADGPKSETPPGHWNVLANDVGDALEEAGDGLRIGGVGEPVDRLVWDVHLYLALNGAVHDAAIVAWGTKRATLGPRPITLVRWMAEHGQRTDPTAPSYDPDGLPLEDDVVELITEASAAPGERHHHLRFHIGEVAVRTWRGEPGDRTNMTSGVGWIRALDWFPYQRRTFVTPAFPGFVSGHSSFSRSAAETLTLFTGSPYFPGGLGTYTANAGSYLVFEDGPSTTLELQWATYQDASDQAGQSRVYGGIHIWPDDSVGRQLGYEVGHLAYAEAEAYWSGAAR